MRHNNIKNQVRVGGSFYHSEIVQHDITFQLLIHDEKGLLSELLVLLANANANIISINSIIPTNGTAIVTITAETKELNITIEEMMAQLSGTHGVVKAEILAG